MNKNRLKVAVVVGHHSYEVQPFQEMFEDIPECHCYIQHLEQFTSSSKEVRESYDAVVFYTMWLNTPVNDGPWYEGAALDALSELGECGQGIFMLHHSILAFQDWPLWKEITGLDPKKYRDYHLDESMKFHITAPEHPIMKGIPDFAMVDEAYESDGVADVSGVKVLMTTDHQKNIPTVAWVKQYKNSRVFSYQSGHCNTSYSNQYFREILRRGILWTAHQL